MRVLMISLLIICTVTNVRAQPGVQAGFNVANLRESYNGKRNEDLSAVFTMNAGFMYRWTILRSLVLQPSLLYSRKGARLVNVSGINGNVDYVQRRLDYAQLSVPALYKRATKQDIDFTVGLGPFMAVPVNVSERVHLTNGKDEKTNYAVGSGEDFYLRPVDAGVRFEGGIRFGRSNLLLAYDLGLVDVSPWMAKTYTRTFSLSIGLFFR